MNILILKVQLKLTQTFNISVFQNLNNRPLIYQTTKDHLKSRVVVQLTLYINQCFQYNYHPGLYIRASLKSSDYYWPVAVGATGQVSTLTNWSSTLTAHKGYYSLAGPSCNIHTQKDEKKLSRKGTNLSFVRVLTSRHVRIKLKKIEPLGY